MRKDEEIRRASSAVRGHLFALGLQALLLSCFAPGVSLSFAKGNTPKGLACLALGVFTVMLMAVTGQHLYEEVRELFDLRKNKEEQK